MIRITGLAKQNIALLASVSFAILASATLMYACEQWLDDWSLIHRMPKTEIETTPQETAKLIAAIPEEHLFGQSIAIGSNVPITDLELRVTGTVAMGKEGVKNNKPSKVYISSGGEPSKIYQQGDMLPSGVKVYDITPSMVILENHGQLERLPLPRQPLQFKHLAALERE